MNFKPERVIILKEILFHYFGNPSLSSWDFFRQYIKKGRSHLKIKINYSVGEVN